MRKELALALALFALLPAPALAGGNGPAVGSTWGIVIIIIALVIGFLAGRMLKK